MTLEVYIYMLYYVICTMYMIKVDIIVKNCLDTSNRPQGLRKICEGASNQRTFEFASKSFRSVNKFLLANQVGSSPHSPLSPYVPLGPIAPLLLRTSAYSCLPFARQSFMSVNKFLLAGQLQEHAVARLSQNKNREKKRPGKRKQRNFSGGWKYKNAQYSEKKVWGKYNLPYLLDELINTTLFLKNACSKK